MALSRKEYFIAMAAVGMAIDTALSDDLEDQVIERGEIYIGQAMPLIGQNKVFFIFANHKGRHQMAATIEEVDFDSQMIIDG